ncbi:MAG: four helix bundle protein [Pirellulaceae bacterium]|jgi:four helix bundle protein|nr:four helix bundle protein [Pirellulaceae bacterium]
MGAYQELPVWQRAVELAEVIHRGTATFPPAERQELARELRRWSLVIPLAIAEHCSLQAAVFLQGVAAAQRAWRQLEHRVLLADRLGYWSAPQAQEVQHGLAEVDRLLHAFVRSLQPADGVSRRELR